MAKGGIQLEYYDTGYNSVDGYWIKVIFNFWYNPAYQLTNDSVRLYYKPAYQSGDAPYVAITSSNADVWKAPGIQNGIAAAVAFLVGSTPPDPSNYYVEYTLKNLTGGTPYKFRPWLFLFKSDGTATKGLKSPDEAPFWAYTLPQTENQPLFEVAEYTIVNNAIDYISWVDFTDCIKLFSYDVNYEELNEDWDDANYVTHRIRARRRVSGKFEMIFPSMARYKRFLYLLEKSRELNSLGPAYVQLRVQINNALDTKSGSTVSDFRCISYTGSFFIKMDNNAWIQPKHGHYGEYSPISVTIQEA